MRAIVVVNFVLVMLAVWPAGVIAQQNGAGLPTTVQLPTFSSFSVQTSVSVPDSGGAYSDAARQARLRPSPGLRPAGATAGSYRSAARGQGGAALGGGLTSVHAQIHPSQPIPSTTTPTHVPSNFADQLRLARESSAGQPAPSVGEARARRRTNAQTQDSRAAQLLVQGDRALAAGNDVAAKIYFQNAARQSTETLRKEAEARLNQLKARPVKRR